MLSWPRLDTYSRRLSRDNAIAAAVFASAREVIHEESRELIFSANHGMGQVELCELAAGKNEERWRVASPITA